MSAIPSERGSTFIRLRREAPGDEAFVFEVYASTRRDELSLTGWDPGTLGAFLQMQFKAMRQGYSNQHPNAEYCVILLEDRPIGRLVVDRGQEAIELVDIALLPEHRGRGTGTGLIRELQAEGNQAMKPIRLQVLKQGGPLRWYERLGFARVGDDGVYVRMEWQPAAGRTAIRR